MKFIILLADGMADRPLEQLGGKTPLEAAVKPDMEAIFRKSTVGMVKTLVEGYPLGSDIGNMSVLGNDPHGNYTGRAALEASSMGLKLEKDDVAFRCNLVTINDGKMEDYSAGHITTEEAGELIEFLDKNLGGECRFFTGKSYRHIMIMKGGEHIVAVPPHDITGQPVGGHMPTGEKASVLLGLMEKAGRLLKDHPVNIKRINSGHSPANMIWFWGQGKRMELKSLKEKYGLDGAVISAVDLVNGIGIAMGMEVISVPGATGYIDTNFKGKARYALEALEKKDFVYVHVEATDEMGHNGDIAGKVLAVEKFNSEVVRIVAAGMKKFGDYKIMITSDHATPIEARTHTDEPVPFVIYNSKHKTANKVKEYSERKIAEESGLYFDRGWELFDYFIKN
jgi:2,3-bisphosphoglycerate-independent phosphoglycerate mutase